MKKLISYNCYIRPNTLRTINRPMSIKGTGMKNQEKALYSFAETKDWFQRELMGNADIVFRELLIGGKEDYDAVLIYMYGNVNQNTLNENVIKQLLTFKVNEEKDLKSDTFAKRIMDSCVSIGKVRTVRDRNKAIAAIFEGSAALIINKINQIVLLEVEGAAKRKLEQPDNEKVLRGSKEGFIEDIWTNVSLIRMTLPDPKLKVDLLKVGRRTKTSLAILYVEGLAEDKLVTEVKERIGKIDIDGVLANGYIEAFIEDNPYSPFPQAQGTEMPDKVVAALLEGKIAIILNRTPFVLLVPAQFVQFFQAPEDYYERPYMGTYVRILRTIAFFVSTTAAPAYIALTSFHPELVPFELLLNLASLRKKVPFPPVVEALVMEFVIESLREAGLRLPTAVATTLGVVGGIILGDVAVSSNLASPSMIIVITITIVCNLVIPNYSMSLVIRLLRLFLIIMAAMFGAFGVTLGWLLIIIHLCKLESFSLPYFAPLAPTRFKDLKDTFIRVPIWAMKLRPDSTPVKDKKRVNNKREHKGNAK